MIHCKSFTLDVIADFNINLFVNERSLTEAIKFKLLLALISKTLESSRKLWLNLRAANDQT